MNYRKLRDFANRMAEAGEPKAPEKGAKVLEYIKITSLFPNAQDDLKYLVAWQQSDTPDRVFVGFSRAKDELPEYLDVWYPAGMFYFDPYITMSNYLTIVHDAVENLNRIIKEND
jgi:hypothetical protein